MYKVLIVEDVDIVREDIKHIIDWKRHGLTVVGDAKNGERGMALYRKHQPDIVITDIKMPVMTGLEMIRKIRETDAGVQFILLTAFEEFEYAKTAMALDVYSYILKHELDEDSLLRELDKQKRLLDERAHIGRIGKFDVIKSHLLAGQEPPEPYALLSQGCRGFLLLAESRGKDIPVHHTALYDKLREQLEARALACAFEYIDCSPGAHLLFLKDPPSASEAKKDALLRSFAGEYQGLLQQYGVETAVAAMPCRDEPACIREAFHALQALNRQKLFRRGSCFFCGEPPAAPAAAREEVQGLLRTVQEGIRELDRTLLEAAVPRLFTEALPESGSVALLEDCVRELHHAISTRNEKREVAGLDGPLDNAMACMRSGDATGISDSFLEAIRLLDMAIGPRYSKRIHAAIRYIDQHYGEDVTLQNLADRLDLSTIYISQLFKREVGTTFSVYLTRVRVEKAVQLLQSGRYKVYEVSAMVGYQSIQYFSKVFKKETGKTPGDYYRR